MKLRKARGPDNVGDPEDQIHQNRDHGGIDKAKPEILTGGVEGQSGDDLTRLRKLDDDDNRRVDRASYNQIGRERKTAEPNPHRTIQDEQLDAPDRDADQHPVADSHDHRRRRGATLGHVNSESRSESRDRPGRNDDRKQS
jgi:hypothetical protein